MKWILECKSVSFLHETPFVKLDLPDTYANVYVKMEKYNLGGSVKARPAEMMILEAEEKGLLTPYKNQTIIECSGGNMGIGLSLIGIKRGYNVELAIPDNYSKQKMEFLRMLGAKVHLADHKLGNDTHYVLAKRLKEENSTAYFINQLHNPMNVKAHYMYTGKEIIESFSSIDAFVSGIGSGGTISGVGLRIKEKFPYAKVIGVEPEGCDTLNGIGVPHSIYGISIGMIPSTLNKNIIDNMQPISFQSVMECAMYVIRTTGLFVGISSYANMAIAIEYAKKIGKGKNVITIAPDTGEHYIETYINYFKNN